MSRNLLIFCILLFSSVIGGLEVVPSVFNSPDSSTVPNQNTFGRDAAMTLASHGEIRDAFELSVRQGSEAGTSEEVLQFNVRLMTELGMYAQADSILALESPFVDEEDVFLHYFRRAKLNAMAGRHHKALDLLGAIDSIHNESFDAYRDLLKLQSCYQVGRLDEAVRVGNAALERGLPPSLTPDFEMALVDVYEARGEESKACDLLRKTESRTPGREDKFGLLEREYDLRVRLGQVQEARATALEIARSYDRYPTAEAVTTDLIWRLSPEKLRSDELLAHADLLIDHSEFRQAWPLLKELDERKLRITAREGRRILKARYYYLTGRYEKSVSLAKPRYRTPAYKRQSILILARSYRKMAESARSARLYEYFAKVFPNDVKAAEALYVASILYDRSGETGEALRVLGQLRKSYPSNYFGRVAALRFAKRLSEHGKHQQSLKILLSSLKRSRHSDEGALFYLARTYSDIGDERRNKLMLDKLRNLDPHSFYLWPQIASVYSRPLTNSTGEVVLEGQFGLIEFLERASDKKTAAYRRIRDVLRTSDTGSEDVEETVCIDRGKWFLGVGFRDWAEDELENARSQCLNSPEDLLELGRTYDRYGMPWRSVRLYQKVKDSLHWKTRREFAAEFRQLMFPVPYPVQVLENSAQYDLPPHLVYAMIREESRFDLNAVSRVGALGLMQLMPATGKYVARELEIPEWGEEFLLEPEINLAFGIWYASSLMDVSQNDPVRMLAAYNAGQANAKRWFEKRSDDSSTIDVVDGIDFKETRSYVHRVVESANIYHSLYFDPDVFGSGPSR